MSILLAQLWIAPSSAFTNDAGYKISVKVDNFEHDTLLLGYYYGNNQYLKDTTIRNKNGKFIFKDDESLKPGLYMIVFPPENKFLELIINSSEQSISINANFNDLQNSASFKGSKDQDLFESYKAFIALQRKKALDIQDSLKKVDSSTELHRNLTEELKEIDSSALAYQKDLIDNHPNTVTGKIIQLSFQPKMPDFEGDEETVRNKTFHYYKEHYWDYVDFNSEAILRTPLLFSKVDNYVKKLTMQVPDSINQSLKLILDKMYPTRDVFMYYAVHYLNEYAKSHYVGMDAVYVFLVNEYYKPGKADWVDSVQLQKIVENAEKLEPLLVGKTAPDIKVYLQDGEPISLYSLQSDYTLLLFWAQDCGHCKKSFPGLIDFYKNYKDKGIEIFAVCSKLMDEEQGCWEFLKEKEGADWINVTDKFMRSGFKVKYNIKSTPQVYLLDKDKKILTKKFAIEKLPEIMDIILEQNKKPESK